MLTKSICLKCTREHLRAVYDLKLKNEAAFSPLNIWMKQHEDSFDIDWSSGVVSCVIECWSFCDITENPPQSCLYSLEHTIGGESLLDFIDNFDF
jgi:hypothetical protein